MKDIPYICFAVGVIWVLVNLISMSNAYERCTYKKQGLVYKSPSGDLMEFECSALNKDFVLPGAAIGRWMAE